MTLGCWAPSRPYRTNSPKAGSSNGTRSAPPTTDCPVGKVCFSPAPSGSSTHYTSPSNKPKPPNYSNDCLLCATTSDCSAKNGTPTPGGNSATPPKRSATSRWSPAPCSYTPDAPTTATTPSPRLDDLQTSSAETQSIPSGLPLCPNDRRRPLRSTPGHQLECDTAAGHHGHRSGHPAGKHQL